MPNANESKLPCSEPNCSRSVQDHLDEILYRHATTCAKIWKAQNCVDHESVTQPAINEILALLRAAEQPNHAPTAISEQDRRDIIEALTVCCNLSETIARDGWDNRFFRLRTRLEVAGPTEQPKGAMPRCEVCGRSTDYAQVEMRGDKSGALKPVLWCPGANEHDFVYDPNRPKQADTEAK